MTGREAIDILKEGKRQNEVMRDSPTTFWLSHQMAEGVKNSEKRIAALDLALSALKEREERSNGCNICKEMDFVYIFDGDFLLKAGYPSFCPECGRPLKGDE